MVLPSRVGNLRSRAERFQAGRLAGAREVAGYKLTNPLTRDATTLFPWRSHLVARVQLPVIGDHPGVWQYGVGPGVRLPGCVILVHAQPDG
jgi:hypothetical protein